MRAFVALEITGPLVIGSMIAFQRELSETKAPLKTVGKENLHFTVKFLGEITPDQAREADRRLRGLRLGRASVEVRGIGAFPSISRPNVIWAGVPASQEELVRFPAQSVIAALEGIGEQDRRPFTAHVTLARVRFARGLGDLASFLRSNSDRSFGETTLNELKLKSSVLGPKGPTYADIGVYPLI